MKINKKNISTLLTVSFLSTFIGLNARIAYADDSKNTEASVVVNAGELSIKSVDAIQFKAIKIDGTSHNVTENTGTAAKVVIEDFRGSNSKGWTLKAKLKSGDFNGLGLKFAPSILSNTSSATAAAETNNLNTQESLIASVADDKITNTEFDTSIQLNSKLNIPAKTKASTYSTTIVWNLASTPETK